MKHKIRPSCATYILLKTMLGGVSLVNDPEGILRDPFKASERAIIKYQHSLGIQYDQRLFQIAMTEKGHYLIYDNKCVMAYTLLRM